MKKPISNSFYCMEITEQEVRRELNSINVANKSTYEMIRPSVLLNVIDIIVSPLTWIYNQSLITGVFPQQLKTARVIPVFKKGDKSDPTNYRPISLLSVFDKILEKLICSRLHSFLSKYGILYKHQYGFRAKHSTTTALCEIMDYIYKSLDDDYYILGLYLDVSKAFDSVNHKILLDKLNYYGVRGTMLMWFKSYLNDRNQFVNNNNVNSDLGNITIGVPQGSALGPLLFLIYINDLHSVTSNGEMRLFADDANHFIRHKNYALLQKSAEIELQNIRIWMSANGLTINFDKTNFTIFSPNSKIMTTEIDTLTIDNHIVKRVDKIKYLGIHIDEGLTWKDHINYLYGKLRQLCGTFYKIRDLLPQPCLRQLYFAMVHSILQYGIEIYANTQISYLHDLQIMQNRIVRTIQFGNLRSKLYDMYKNYNILPINLLHMYRLGLFVFNFINLRSHLPLSFSNFFSLNIEVHSHGTRNSYDMHFEIFLKSFGKRALQYRASVIWNNLSADLKNIKSPKVFKKQFRASLYASF